MMKKKAEDKLRFWLLLGALLLGGGFINAWELAGEARISRKALKDFPRQVGTWRQMGIDTRFDAEIEKVLHADDYLSRDYESQDGRIASFYVGYYATQRNGATYHSPLNCLPGSGWVMSDPARVTITPTDGGVPFETNRFVIANCRGRPMINFR